MKPFTVRVVVILHAILFSYRNRPVQTSHCIGGGNIACHIFFAVESACSNLSCLGGGNISCHIIFVAESACSTLSMRGWRKNKCHIIFAAELA